MTSDQHVATEVRLPIGVRAQPLVSHSDMRGGLTELFRGTWETGLQPVQWNFSSSRQGVLRGVHVHVLHHDYLILLTGQASVGLRDLRRGSPTEGQTALVDLRSERPLALTIPPGVAHGFYYHEPSTHVYAMDEYWSLADELGCHWADPSLQIPWPVDSAIVSERDAALPPLNAILDLIPAFAASTT